MPNIAIPQEHRDEPIAYAITHFAPEQTGALYEFSKQVYKRSILPLREFEAARARIALINGCLLCQQFRSMEDVPTYLAGMGDDSTDGVHNNGPAPDEAFYLNIASWKDSPIYSEREKLAIEFAERFSFEPDPLGYDEAFWTRLKSHFSEKELYELALAVAYFVAAGRFVHVLGFDQQDACEMRSAQQEPAE